MAQASVFLNKKEWREIKFRHSFFYCNCGKLSRLEQVISFLESCKSIET